MLLKLPLVGEFQVENALVAAGIAIGIGSEPAAVSPRSKISRARKGGWSGSANATARRSSSITRTSPTRWPRRSRRAAHAKRKLVVVFGAGGDRDAGKRPLMGAIAAEDADSVIVTDDNPRSENPAAIRAAIIAAAKSATRSAIARRRYATGYRRCSRAMCCCRRQGARDRPDRRRQGVAVQRSRGGRGRAGSEGGMSVTPLWTIAEVARRLGLAGEYPTRRSILSRRTVAW